MHKVTGTRTIIVMLMEEKKGINIGDWHRTRGLKKPSKH